jgi:3-methyladenine DNA glycosylase AlkD
MSRSSGDFDASRYFRGDHRLRFYNIGASHLRLLSREIHLAQRERWTLKEAIAFADLLMPDPYLEVKAVGLEVVARYRRDFTPTLLGQCKRWLANGYAANWATTDEMCGVLIGPVLLTHPELIPRMRGWSAHRNMWVRRASIVGLLPPVRRGSTHAVDLVYEIAKRLHSDPNDLIHKAVGWALREAGKIDSQRLERYLRANVRVIPRTTFRYAIERFTALRRRELLVI